MGYVPLPMYVQRYPDSSTRIFYGDGTETLKRRVERGRHSKLPWRRRAAAQAARELIRRRELELGLREHR